MNIIIGSDHRGFELKEYILKNFKHEMYDLGCYDNSEIDFVDIVFDMMSKWTNDSIGILICKTGIGMSICANRFPNIRAAICKTVDDVISARSHNNANVIILGAQNENDDILTMLDNFLNINFDSDTKYGKRVDKINNIK